MSRRVSLPNADDLFRPTSDAAAQAPAPRGRKGAVRAVPDAPATPEPAEPVKAPSGRVKHDEKITVYVTSAELIELEQARLKLRGEFAMAVDRGRLVREALHIVLAGLEAEGEDSALVRRLRE